MAVRYVIFKRASQQLAGASRQWLLVAAVEVEACLTFKPTNHIVHLDGLIVVQRNKDQKGNNSHKGILMMVIHIPPCGLQ